MSHDELLKKLSELIENMAFDYDRMSTSGQQTYEEICSIMSQLMR